MKFTGVKDTDRIILNKLNDKDLLSICSTNKSWRNFCNTDQTFWMNRVYNKFPYLSSDIINKYRNDKTWSEYYIDLRKINKNDKQSYLCGASKDGRLDLVMISITEGANIDTGNGWALIVAAVKGHLDVVKYLVERGANIHAQDNYALRLAALNGHLDVVKYLVEKGANIHSRDDLALRSAAEYGHLDVVKYLKSLS